MNLWSKQFFKIWPYFLKNNGMKIIFVNYYRSFLLLIFLSRLVSGRKFSGPGWAGPKNFPKKSARARPGQNLLSKKSARAETGRKNYGPGQKGPNFFGEHKPKRAQKIDKCHKYLLKPYYLRSPVGAK